MLRSDNIEFSKNCSHAAITKTAKNRKVCKFPNFFPAGNILMKTEKNRMNFIFKRHLKCCGVKLLNVDKIPLMLPLLRKVQKNRTVLKFTKFFSADFRYKHKLSRKSFPKQI